MIGLGCGARSYTQNLHYSSRFAVTKAGVQAILRSWIAQCDDDLCLATHGIWLNDEEKLRRFVIMSLLQSTGLLIAELQDRFPAADLSQIHRFSELVDRAWVVHHCGRMVLTSIGLQNSDAVGPLLYSEPVRARLEEFIALRSSERATEPT
jgi:oxygen-independent coproporphyrinogen-3 oxidase